jgi:predicted DsbA family dithiol-disulfide isomerase
MMVSSTLQELRKQYGDDLRLVWKNYVVHPQTAMLAAWGGCAAAKQGKFFEYERKVWDKGWSNGRFLGNLNDQTLLGIAGELALDADRFKADLNGTECKGQVDADLGTLSRVGVHATPAFFINGRFISGAVGIDVFKSVIDQELKKATEAIARGVKPEAYYGSIVANGKKALE